MRYQRNKWCYVSSQIFSSSLAKTEFEGPQLYVLIYLCSITHTQFIFEACYVFLYNDTEKTTFPIITAKV